MIFRHKKSDEARQFLKPNVKVSGKALAAGSSAN